MASSEIVEYDGHKMRSKIYYLTCEEHPFAPIKNYLPDWKTRIVGYIINEYTHAELKKELASDSFDYHSSIVIIISFSCFCSINDFMDPIYEIINENYALKYVSKTVLYLYWTNLVTGNPPIKFNDIRLGLPKVNNLNILQYFTNDRNWNRDIGFESYLTTIFKSMYHRFEATQSGLCHFVFSYSHNKVKYAIIYYYSTTNCGLYMYAINPSLMITLSHQLNKRVEGTEMDLESLKEAARSKRIPHITMPDGSLQSVKLIVSLIKTWNLSFLKYLFINIMSHGWENDIIYCDENNSYNLQEELIRPLKTNKSLGKVKIFIFVNACRGGYNPENATYDEDEEMSQKIQERNEMIDQPTNIVVWRSTQEGWVSYRDDDGSPFVQHYSKAFKDSDTEVVMEELYARVHDFLKEEENQITEYVSKKGVTHVIKTEMTELSPFYLLVEEIKSLFEQTRISQGEAKNVMPYELKLSDEEKLVVKLNTENMEASYSIEKKGLFDFPADNIDDDYDDDDDDDINDEVEGFCKEKPKEFSSCDYYYRVVINFHDPNDKSEDSDETALLKLFKAYEYSSENDKESRMFTLNSMLQYLKADVETKRKIDTVWKSAPNMCVRKY